MVGQGSPKERDRSYTGCSPVTPGLRDMLPTAEAPTARQKVQGERSLRRPRPGLWAPLSPASSLPSGCDKEAEKLGETLTKPSSPTSLATTYSTSSFFTPTYACVTELGDLGALTTILMGQGPGAQNCPLGTKGEERTGTEGGTTEGRRRGALPAPIIPHPTRLPLEASTERQH